MNKHFFEVKFFTKTRYYGILPKSLQPFNKTRKQEIPVSGALYYLFPYKRFGMIQRFSLQGLIK
jgi:hypothetical protein